MSIPEKDPPASPDRAETSRLVDASRRGDERAFAALHDRYVAYVHGILLAHAPPEEVRDLAQETFLTAWRELASLRDPAAFGGWIATIARNAARMQRRRALTLVPLDPAIPAGVREPELDGSTVLAAIRALPEAYRETLLLRLVEGMSGPEIAERTGLTHGSVLVNLHRGMQLLRARLGWTT